MGRRGRTAVVSLLASLALGACASTAGDRPGADQEPTPSPSVRTLAPLTAPPRPPATGRLFADLRQSSRDAALGRMQVWIRNDRESDLRPTRITYVDGRYRAPLAGGRLRLIPARSFRGYTLALPPRPRCDSTATGGRVTVEQRGRRETVPVEDEADVVARYVATTCLQEQVSRIADISFADTVAVDRPGEGGIGTLVLVVRPSGRPGAGTLTIDTVAGTPLLSSYQVPFWTPDLTVASTDDEVRVELPVHPARCDEHGFMEAAGATALRVKLHLGDQEGELIVRMSDRGASHAIAYVRDSCGL